jgi:hypothetical protein
MASASSAPRIAPVLPKTVRGPAQVPTESQKVEAARLAASQKRTTPRQLAVIADVVRKNMAVEEADVDLGAETVAFIAQFPDAIQPILWRQAQNRAKGRPDPPVDVEDVQRQFDGMWASQARMVEAYRNEAVEMLDEATRVMEAIEVSMLSWRVRPVRLRMDGRMETEEERDESVRMARSSDRHWALRELTQERPGRLLISVDDRVYPVQPPSGHHGAASGEGEDETYAEAWARDRVYQHPYFELVDRLYGPYRDPSHADADLQTCHPEHEVSDGRAGCAVDDGESGL